MLIFQVEYAGFTSYSISNVSKRCDSLRSHTMFNSSFPRIEVRNWTISALVL